MNFSGKVEFKPKAISELKNYSWAKFRGDLIAGIVVGIVALPLAIAFGIASGVTPSIGLITAANEVVNDPSSVGTALKTLTLRLRGSKTELEEMISA